MTDIFLIIFYGFWAWLSLALALFMPFRKGQREDAVIFGVIFVTSWLLSMLAVTPTLESRENAAQWSVVIDSVVAWLAFFFAVHSQTKWLKGVMIFSITSAALHVFVVFHGVNNSTEYYYFALANNLLWLAAMLCVIYASFELTLARWFKWKPKPNPHFNSARPSHRSRLTDSK